MAEGDPLELPATVTTRQRLQKKTEIQIGRLMMSAKCLRVVATFIACLTISSAVVHAEEEGFRSIFDGNSLEGWDGDLAHWRIEDGALTGETTKEKPLQANTFLVWRGADGKATVTDFELRLKLRISGGNSGIQFRSQEVKKWVIAGYQADFDSENAWSGILYDERGRGVLAKRGEKVVLREGEKPQVTGVTTAERDILSAIRKADWNDYRILADGNRLQLFINGKCTVDITDNDEKNRDFTGLLALQLHAGPAMKIQFKDIRIRDLAPKGQGSALPRKKILFVAGKPSHGYGNHEHYAGSMLLANRLRKSLPQFDTEVIRNGWPSNDSFFDGADVIVMYADGGKSHPALPHLDTVNRLAGRGVGIACLHYGVEVPEGPGGDALLDWIGGYFEANWSVNPHWNAEFHAFPDHPVTRGVQPFKCHDEWYFNMRFREGMAGVTPVLSAIPPASTMDRRDGPHSGNPQVRAQVAAGQPQHLAWVLERADGGRGFGLTGAHFHRSWANDDFRKLVLNAIVWLAKEEVPVGGVSDSPVTSRELEENQDFPKPATQAG